MKLAAALSVEKRMGSICGTTWYDRIIYTSTAIRAAKNFYDLSAGNISEDILVDRLHLLLGMYKTHHEDSQNTYKQAET